MSTTSLHHADEDLLHVNANETLFFAGMMLFLLWMLYRMLVSRFPAQLPARDVTKGHRWFDAHYLNCPPFCSICSQLCVSGWVCDSCAVCACAECRRSADVRFECKPTSVSGPVVKHHWTPGNIGQCVGDVILCAVCDSHCELECAQEDAKCCWCQRVVHGQCLPKMGEICDLGKYRAFIVPPCAVRLKWTGIKGRRHLVVKEVIPPTYSPWHPLIVIANRKSGNHDGGLVLNAFRTFLNPAQVIDLTEVTPESALEWCRLVPQHRCYILIAGGDGTINWILTVVDKLKISPKPAIAVIPLGTGNDLSRVLGWGPGCAGGDIDVPDLLTALKDAQLVSLDRWRCTIMPDRRRFNFGPKQEKYMTNYASVGVDALVALNFHKTRESAFYLWRNRLFNKFLYLTFGTKDTLERKCRDLQNKIRIFLDDVEIKDLPDLEGVAILNIDSWGAGVRPWHMGSRGSAAPQHAMDDGMLEVMGLYSSFHVAQLQVGLSEPVRLGQAKVVKLVLLERLPVQLDGEPWEQAPSTLVFEHYSVATMLRAPNATSSDLNGMASRASILNTSGSSSGSEEEEVTSDGEEEVVLLCSAGNKRKKTGDR